MFITINKKKYKVNHPDLEKIFEEQKQYVKKIHDEQGLETYMMALMTFHDIAEQSFQEAINKGLTNEILEALQATEVK